MRAGSIVVLALAAAIDPGPARACDPAGPAATLGRGICALESVPEGVRARSGVDGASWTIACPGPRGDPRAAPPVAGAIARGAAGDAFREATPGVIKQGQALGVIKQGQAVDVQVNDGATLWLGVSERRGDGVRPWGLVRYDSTRGAAHDFRGTDAGPCGFLVQDLLLRGDTLWVATDLGVSRLRVSPEDWDEWTHYGLSTDGTALEETACGSLLAVVAEAAAAPGGEALGRVLAEFRPKFVRRLAARIRAPKRGMRPASTVVGRRN